FVRTIGAQLDWQETLRDAGVSAAILDPRGALAAAMDADPGWHRAFPRQVAAVDVPADTPPGRPCAPGTALRRACASTSSSTSPQIEGTATGARQALEAGRAAKGTQAMTGTAQGYHFGVSLPQISRTWDETCSAAETFERLGYDSVWLNDHLYGVPRPDIPI